MSETVIGKRNKIEMTLEMLEGYKAISSEQAKYLKEAINGGKSIVVIGRSGSGKTTLASALMREANEEKTVSLGEMRCNSDIIALVETLKEGKTVIAARHDSLHEAEDLPNHIADYLDECLNNGTIIEVETVMDSNGHRRVNSISGEKTFEMLEYNTMASEGTTYNQMGSDCGRIRCNDIKTIKQDLKDKRIFITAGSIKETDTEKLLVSNKDTCEMGYRLAEEAMNRGTYVTLVADLVDGLEVPDNISFFRVGNFKEMKETMSNNRKSDDILIEAYTSSLDLSSREDLKNKSKTEIANEILDEIVKCLK